MASNLNYDAYASDTMGEAIKASNYVDHLYATQAKKKAGAQFASGDYAGAADTTAQQGDIAGASSIQQYSAKQGEAQHQYLQQAAPVLQQIYQKASQNGANPQAGAQALNQAFDHIAQMDLPRLGMTPQQIEQYKQAFATDPQGTLQNLSIAAKKNLKFQQSGNSVMVLDGDTGQLIGQHQGSEFKTIKNGDGSESLVQVGGQASSPDASSANPAGAVNPPASAGDAAILPSVDPAAVRQAESNNNPNAVSSAGAQGTMQVMPTTQTDPGYGVTPAKDNSPAELERVGNDYLGAMGQHFGNPVYQLVANNWGPGNAQKWIAAGAHFDQLPRETREYIGRVALAQVTGKKPPAMGAQDQPAAPAQDGGVSQPSVQTLFTSKPKPAGEALSDEDADMWGTMLLQQGPAALSNFGRGNDAAASLKKIHEHAAAIARSVDMSPAQIIAMQGSSKANVLALAQLVKQRTFVESNSETARKAGAYVLSLAPKGGAQGQSPIFNKWKQWVRGDIQGDADVAKFNFAINTLASEYAKVKTGAYGAAGNTDSAQHEAENLLRGYDNYKALSSRIDAMFKEMDFKKQSYVDQEAALRNDVASAMPGAKKTATGNGGVIKYDAQGNRIQ